MTKIISEIKLKHKYLNKKDLKRNFKEYIKLFIIITFLV